MTDSLVDRARSLNGILTPQRQLICRIIEESNDHPSVEVIIERAKEMDRRISAATVYRFLKLLQDAGLVRRHDFGESSGRFEIAEEDQHDHLIDTETGDVVEFQDAEFDRLKTEIANRLGYRLERFRVELYGTKLN